MLSVVKLPINESKLRTVVDSAIQYALTNGFIMGSSTLPKHAVSYSPFCLFPSTFSRIWFNYAKEIQTTVNILIHKVATDPEFLTRVLQRTVESDEFTKNLFDIYKQVNEEGVVQDLSLGLLRSDYMLNGNRDEPITGMKQVEINTIASSFGGLITKLHGLHSYVLGQFEVDVSNFPETQAASKVAQGLLAAKNAYGVDKSVILFLIEKNVTNFGDQRTLEYLICEADSKVKILRATFKDVRENGNVRNKCLYFNGQEVAVVYYRTGYVPEQYENKEDWETRLMIERSKAIKCPTVAYQLAGSKKVQQELTLPGVLESFLPNNEDVKRIRKIFANQYSLDLNEDGDKAAELALDQPECFVMKPQREGGGNNIYGEDILETLERVGSTKEREGFILMELINPPAMKNYVLRPGKPANLCNVTGEIGIYGVILGTKSEIKLNYEAGHMMRSKVVGTNEGGVAAGYGVLDLPCLL